MYGNAIVFITETLILGMKHAISVVEATSSVINHGLALYASDEGSSVPFVKMSPLPRSSLKHPPLAFQGALSQIQ